MKKFFAAETSPINLAVFRILLFYALLRAFPLDALPYILWFARLPRDMMVFPQGLGWLQPHLPVTPEWAGISLKLFTFFAVTGLLGIFSRTSAALCLILGFYVMGIPQFFGKVNHYHHLLWFAALLAVSPCGDALSLDALWKKWKGKKDGEAFRAYALPLRFAWILMGICYFFPGFWKLKTGGFAWIFSDNLKYIFYYKWATLNGWLPFFRLDHYPLLYRASALAVVLFECSFIFLIFFPRLRWLAALGGIAFHEASKVFLAIDFWALEIFFLTFIDWGAFAEKFSFRNTGDMPLIAEGRNAYVKRIWLVGGFLVAANLFCGFGKIINSWPFSCYPTFDSVLGSAQRTGIEIALTAKDGSAVPLDKVRLSRKFSPERLEGLVTSMLYDMSGETRDKTFRGFIQMLRKDGFITRKADKIGFYKIVFSTLPEEKDAPPLKWELLYEASLRAV